MHKKYIMKTNYGLELYCEFVIIITIQK